MKSVSVVIPALNERDGIGLTVRSIPSAELRKMGYDVQIVVVDNGSTDGTGQIASDAGAVVVLEPRRGYGRAYKAGFAHATGDIVATADADMTYPVGDIPSLIRMIEKEDLDFITTNRFAYLEKEAMTLQKRIGNALLNANLRTIFRMRIEDSQSGMWVFRRSLLERMVLRSDGMPLSEEIKVEAVYFLGCRWKEVPIHYRGRVGTVKLRTFRDGFSNMVYLLKKRVRR